MNRFWGWVLSTEPFLWLEWNSFIDLFLTANLIYETWVGYQLVIWTNTCQLLFRDVYQVCGTDAENQHALDTAESRLSGVWCWSWGLRINMDWILFSDVYQVWWGCCGLRINMDWILFSDVYQEYGTYAEVQGVHKLDIGDVSQTWYCWCSL